MERIVLQPHTSTGSRKRDGKIVEQRYDKRRRRPNDVEIRGYEWPDFRVVVMWGGYKIADGGESSNRKSVFHFLVQPEKRAHNHYFR